MLSVLFDGSYRETDMCWGGALCLHRINKFMKKIVKVLIVILVVCFIMPQIALASWWNPFSWGIWGKISQVFHRTDNQTQVLENRVKELENKLDERSTLTPDATETNKPTNTGVNQPVTPPVVVQQPAVPDPQIKIEGCKSEYNANKSAKFVELEKQLNSFKSLMDDIAVKAYQDCISNGARQSPVGIGPSAYTAYITTVKAACQSSFNEGQTKATVIIADNRTSEYNKLEQQLQQEYQACLNK